MGRDTNPSLATGQRLSNPTPGDEVVITGIAGRYPESDNVYELQEHLFNKVDLVTDDSTRLFTNDPDIPKQLGKIKQLNKFDADFFGIEDEEADFMDPTARIVMEIAYEAIVDAGINPREFRGSRTGVFIGASVTESEGNYIYQNDTNGFGIMGCSRAMLANRISSWLGITGPSFAIDSACSSGSYAFDQAFKSIRNGHCEAALVGGTNTCLNPNISLQFSRLGVISSGGRCKVFDVNADGYARAECISIILLQKMAQAKRVYAKVVYTKTNCDGFKDEGVTFPSEKIQLQLLKSFYEECGVSPQDVGYVEAHGTGTRVGDTVETKALDASFSPGRTNPLKIGSIKSNIGHTEPAAGIAALTKACIIFETGTIPPNLNFVSPLPGPVKEGRLKVVTEKTPLEGDFIGINSFGFGGGNCHMLLKRHKKQKPTQTTFMHQSSRLVVMSGRTEASVHFMLNDVVKREFDPEYFRLINDVHQDRTPGHRYRGFAVIADSKLGAPICVSRELNYIPEFRNLIWFVFTGLWSKEFATVKQFLMIPAFSKTITRCNQILSPMGLDVLLIYSRTSLNFMESMIGSVCIQIGLVNTLESIGITPDYIIGDSIGELACAFADKCLTMEQTVLAAYYVGKALMEAKYENLSSLDSVVCRRINKYLKTVITEPMESSDKWISLSASTGPTLNCKRFCSADGIAENLSRDVCLDNIYKCISPNAIALQIGFLENALTTRKKCSKNITYVELLQNSNVPTVLGKLYLAGFDLNVAKLYPTVEFPVSRGTPMISPLVKWDHSKNRAVTKFIDGSISGRRTVEDEELKYLSGHVIDGRTLFPATGYLQLVWESIAMMRGKFFKNVSVVFEEVQFLRATNIPKEGSLEFAISVQKESGNFEIIESEVTVVSGRVFIPEDITKEQANLEFINASPADCGNSLVKDDIYKEFHLRGYNYSGSFRGLVSCDNKGNSGEILWENNWVCFLDNMIQLLLITKDTRHLLVPTAIQKLSIDCNAHAQNIFEKNDRKFVQVYHYEALGILKSAGVEVRGISASAITRRSQETPVLEVQKFVPYFSNSVMALQDILYLNISLALENSPSFKIKIVEVVKDSSVELIAEEIRLCLNNVAIVQPEIVIIKDADVILSDPGEDVVIQENIEDQSNCFMITGKNLTQDDQLLQQAVDALSKNGFLLLREQLPAVLNVPSNLQLVTSYETNNERLLLFKKKFPPRAKKAIRIDDQDSTFSWLDEIKRAVTTDDSVVLYAESQVTNGILGFVNCIRKEPGGEQVQCVFILDKTAPPFRVDDDFYIKQLNLNLAVNILRNGQWGSYRYLPMNQKKLIKAEHAFINVRTRGDLSSLQWFEGPLTKSSAHAAMTTLVQPYFGSLNFRDIMEATNKLPGGNFDTARNKQIAQIGFEYAGVTKSGRRVMGFGLPPLLSTLIQANDYFMWDVPDEWTLQEAATVPVVYGTVLYAFVIVGGIRQGMDVLIHAGSGAVGQAAINVALHYKCTVYTTVGTKEKRDFIKKQFPQLKDCQIGNSRDTSFEQLVLTKTKGRGVNLVLNSLAEDKLFASVRCLASNGRFLEIGKFDLMNNNKLDIGNFTRGISFHGVMLDRLVFANKERKEKLNKLLADGIKSGIVRPLTFTTFKYNQVEDAFRYMAAGKHIGKVLIQLRNEEHDNRNQLMKSPIFSIPRFHCQPNMTYVLCGGLGGFGLELADWLVLRGAMKLVITSRHGITTGYQGFRVQTWRGYGCTVKISTVDCTTLKGCEDLLRDAESIGPVAAIFNLAVVLRDAILENQTLNNFKEAFAPKVDVTRYLDIASRKYCPQLKYFVVFSSISCGRGNAGQTNYGMANSVMERICEARVQEGFPGLAIQWGAVGDVGLFATMQESGAHIEISGTLPQSIRSCLEVMDTLLKSSEPVVSSMILAQKLSQTHIQMTAIEYAAKLIGVRDVRLVSAQTTFPELGMDSLMVVEMKQGFERDYGIFLTAKELRQLTFTKLKELTEPMNQLDDSFQENGLADVNEKESFNISLNMNRFCSESEATEVLLELPSLGTDVTPTVFLIPGIEGVSTSLKPLASKLKCRVLCLQLAYQSSYRSVEEISKELLPHVRDRIKTDATFYFVGYSFGCLVALELTRMLESEGRRGRLCFIDGAPGLLKQLSETENKKQELQINVLTNLLHKSPMTSSQMRTLLRSEPMWDKKLQILLHTYPTDSMYSKSLLKFMCNSIYFRLIAHGDYDPDHKTLLKSHVVLIRPTINAATHAQDDYSLSTWTETRVPVHFIVANHATVVDTDQCADIINEFIVSL